MPFAPIHNALIAEDVRLERRRLTSILGFYGIMPHVEIVIRDLGVLTNERFTFMLLGGSGKGTFQISATIRSEVGQEILNLPPKEVVIETGQMNFSLILNAGPLAFPQVGTYTFELVVDRAAHFSSTFKVRQGIPQDFE